MLSNRNNSIPFAVQWVWPIPIGLGVLFAPESPWWLVRKGRNEDAKKALLALTSRNHPTFNADETVAMMVYTNEIEKQNEVGTSYWDCFKGVDLRRTEISCVTWAIQNLSGSAFMGFSTYFFQQAGLATTASFDLAMAQYSLGAIGTIGSWFLMMWCGRRTLYLAGLTTQFTILMVIGFLALAPASNSGASWAIGSMMLVYTFVYDLSVGPVCYDLVPEIPANRLRTKTVVLARNTYNLIGLVNNVIIPYMLNPQAWNWKGKSGFFWAGLCFCCAVWTYFRLPEPNRRTYGELDILFEKKVSARNFKKTVVDPFHNGTIDQVEVSRLTDDDEKPRVTEI
jgi:SP family general alpha glucoside:H+ symporter-like MFS transporter